MYLRSLFLQNFRCYEKAHFEFSTGVNLIYGANALGKTTLLEAIHLLVTGRSFRASQLSDLIRTGASHFYIEALFVKNEIEQVLRFSYDGKERKINYNASPIHQVANLLGVLQGVTMIPDDAALVKGGPAGRRHFLDLQIAQVDPLYVHFLTRFQRAMRQRNVLLKGKTTATLDGWEQELAHAGAYLVYKRLEAIDQLQAHAESYQKGISRSSESLKVHYKTAASGQGVEAITQDYVQHYRKSRSRELFLGTTLVGPHRDDVQIAIGEKEARYFASEGQQRSCVISLRLAEWKRVEQVANEKPLMLLDDLLISLDGDRRDSVLALLDQLGQVFLTSTQKVHLADCHYIEI